MSCVNRRWCVCIRVVSELSGCRVGLRVADTQLAHRNFATHHATIVSGYCCTCKNGHLPTNPTYRGGEGNPHNPGGCVEPVPLHRHPLGHTHSRRLLLVGTRRPNPRCGSAPCFLREHARTPPDCQPRDEVHRRERAVASGWWIVRGMQVRQGKQHGVGFAGPLVLSIFSLYLLIPEHSPLHTTSITNRQHQDIYTKTPTHIHAYYILHIAHTMAEQQQQPPTVAASTEPETTTATTAVPAVATPAPAPQADLVPGEDPEVCR